MRNDDQPPAGAISLSEFFERADPPLLEAQRQAEERLKAAEAVVPRRPSWFDDSSSYYTWAEPAYREHPAVRAVAQLRNEVANARQAVHDERLGRLRSGEWLGWGLENSAEVPGVCCPPTSGHTSGSAGAMFSWCEATRL
jgi:hypothetical protein